MAADLFKDVDERFPGTWKCWRWAAADDRPVIDELPVTQDALGGRHVVAWRVPTEQNLDHLDRFLLETCATAASWCLSTTLRFFHTGCRALRCGPARRRNAPHLVWRKQNNSRSGVTLNFATLCRETWGPKDLARSSDKLTVVSAFINFKQCGMTILTIVSQ